MIELIIDNNIDRIRADLISNGLTLQSLVDDILDHICCMVEEEMIAGNDFDTSYKKVVDSIGENRLPEIQHQTLLLTNKKFQQMKKVTYFVGLSSSIIVLLGTLFKRMHWPGAGIMLFLGLLLVVAVFLPLFFVVSYREQTEKKSLIYPLAGYSTLALLLCAAIFKTQHWAGAEILIDISLAVLVIGFVPLYVVSAFQKNQKGKVSIAYIIMLLVGIGVISLSYSYNMGKDQLEMYRSESVVNESKTINVEKRTAELKVLFSESATDDKAEVIDQVHNSVADLQEMIAELKSELLNLIDEPGVPVSDVRKVDNKAAGKEVLVKSGKGKALVTGSADYLEMLKEIIDDEVVIDQIEQNLDYTAAIWQAEHNQPGVLDDPFIKNYYKLTYASLGLALSEYIAISTVLHQ